ncbi:MAG: hypothetical protein AAGG48_03850 [Planctomycetota bacterium]
MNARFRTRRGIGLLEVIACTGLVALMIVPLAGVIRASGQSIADANGDGSQSTQMRQGLRYLTKTIRDGEISLFRQNRISVRMPDGTTAAFRVRGQKLEMRQSGETTVVVENVRRVRFIQRRERNGDRRRTGIEIQLTARDPDTRRNVRINAAVATPPQA